MTELLELQQVAKCFDAAGREDAPRILEGVDLTIRDGESVAIVGPSGSGKSTLLNIIGGLLPPTSGRVLLDGADLAAASPNELARIRNRRIGFVFQAHHLLPQCTALENVLLPTLVDMDAGERAAAVERARSLLARVGLEARTDHLPAQLSGGEAQRVAVVRAVIRGPRLLLADEPTGSLDARASESLTDLLCELNTEESITLLTVTHSVQLAARMARTLELRDRRLSELEVGA